MEKLSPHYSKQNVSSTAGLRPIDENFLLKSLIVFRLNFVGQ